MKIEVHCDGACSVHTDNIGGYGIVLKYGVKRKEIAGSAINTTNNQMELMAAITALKAINEIAHHISCDVTIISDSQYVVKGMTEWLPNWQRSGWRTAAKKPVKNRELWMELSELAGKHNVTFKWTRGHASCKENNRCDELATQAIEQRRKETECQDSTKEQREP